MKRTRSLVVGLAAITGLVFAAPGGVGPAVAKPPRLGPLTYSTYMVPVSGAASTIVAGYNVHGVAVGTYVDDAGQHGFIDSDISDSTIEEVLLPADAPTGSSDLRVTSINDTGSITGTYWTGSTQHGFLRTGNGSITAIDVPGLPVGSKQGTVASQVSNGGEVVGYSFTTIGSVGEEAIVSRGFVWRNGAYIPYDAPDALTDPVLGAGATIGTEVLGINTAGIMVGSYVYWGDGVGVRAGFTTLGDTFTRIFYPDSSVTYNWCGYTIATGISDTGVVVGNAGNGCGGSYFPWTWTPAKDRFTDLRSSNPKMTITRVDGVNSAGEMTGTWADSAGVESAFIAHR